MAPPVRRPRPSLIDRLFAEPRAYALFQAIRLVERAGAADARERGRALPDPVGRGIDPQGASVSIRASVPLAFAAAEVVALTRREGAPPELTQTVVGLTGPSGVLPHVFSEIVQASVREREFGLRAFLDLFNNRAAGLLYDAWAKHRLVIERERRGLPGTRAPIEAIVEAVVGLGQPALKERMSVPDATPLHFSGLLGHRIRSARSADQTLGGALGYAVRVEQFHGTWLPLAPGDRTRLPGGSRPAGTGGPAGTFCRLGEETIAGARVWDVQGSVRLVVGPLDYRAFLAFLPGGALADYLNDLAPLALGPEVAVYTRLVLRAEAVPRLRLCSDPRATPDGRLGLNTWLGWDGQRTRPGEVDLRARSPLR